MERGLERDHRGTTGRDPRDLDGVLDCLCARIEERRSRRACERSDGAEALGELDVRLVRHDREVGVDEPRSLLLDRLDDARVAMADVDHSDAAREVDEGVAVDVRDRGVQRLGDEHRQVHLERLRDRAGRRARGAPASSGRGSRCESRSTSSQPPRGAYRSARRLRSGRGPPRARPRPARAVRPLVRGGGGGRRAPSGADGPRDRDARRVPVGADGAAQGPRRARLRLLHEPREPKGRRARRRTRRAAAALYWELAEASGADRRDGRPRRGRRVCRVLPHAPARQPDQRLGVAAVRGAREPGRARAAGGCDRGALCRDTRCRCRRSGAGTGSSRRRSSSGRDGRTASTTACATSSSDGGWARERLGP